MLLVSFRYATRDYVLGVVVRGSYLLLFGPIFLFEHLPCLMCSWQQDGSHHTCFIP